jgi:hypothetical protein
MSWDDGLRRSGATERMLRDVAAAFDEPDADVVVLCASWNQAGHLAARLHEMMRGERVFRRVGYAITAGTRRVRFFCVGGVSLVDGRIAGHSGPVFADHRAIEVAMPWALQQWARYRLPR